MKRISYESLKNYRRSVSEIDPKILQTVTEIIDKVRKEGDKALLELAMKFDKVDPKNFRLEVTPEEKKAARILVEKDYSGLLKIFLDAVDNITFYHKKQKEESWEYERDGAIFGQKALPIDRAGLYIPGGKAFYPSSVLMNVIPAKIAGVQDIILCTPPDSNGNINPLLIALADMLGVARIFKCGGAQAVAAMAYGTETIPAVFKITGPGNMFVATAKRLVQGQVGIDSIAGSSEVMLFADESARPEWAAIDLCAQAEHSSDNTAIFVTTSEKLLNDTEAELEKLLPTLSRKDIINESLSKNAFTVVVKNIEEGFDLVNRIAPEHIEVVLKLSNKEILSNIRNAGAVFIGEWTPVAASDYFAGLNHVIPTNGTAAFSSPLGVYDFMKRVSYLSLSEDYITLYGESIAKMADFEGLSAHADSLRKRI